MHTKKDTVFQLCHFDKQVRLFLMCGLHVQKNRVGFISKKHYVSHYSHNWVRYNLHFGVAGFASLVLRPSIQIKLQFL
jgi:hypothetical protein